MLATPAEKRGKQWQLETKIALKSIKATEKMKGIFKQITTTIKGIHEGGIRQLYVHSESNQEYKIDSKQPDNPNHWLQVNDTE